MIRHLESLLSNDYVNGLAASVVVVAFLASLRDLFGSAPPVLLCLVAVIVAVWRGNLGAGLATVAFSVIGSAYILEEPYESLMVSSPSELVRLALLAAVGSLISVVVASVRRRETAALNDAHARSLELRTEIAQRREVEEALLKAKARLEEGVALCSTELREADQEIRRQARYMDAFFQHSLTPWVVLDREFNFVRVNQAYAAACRQTVEEFAGRNHFDLYPSDAKAIFEEVVRSRKPYQAFARPFVFPDHPEWGETYWDWTLTPLIDDSGEVEVLFFALEDVTERRRGELALDEYRRHLESVVSQQTGELEQANERLKADISAREAAEGKRLELEGMLTKIAATAPGVICSFRLRADGRQCFPYASPAITEIYGIPPETLAQDATPAFALIPAEDIERVSRSIGDSASELTPWQDEWRVNHAQKGQIWVEGKSIPTREPDGSTIWFGFIHDITERKQVEESLRQADRRKNEFLAMLGHELRNPLAPIRNAVQILSVQPPRDPTEAWAREVIERQISHMTRLLDDLLDVARIMYGKVRLLRERTDLGRIVEFTAETFRPLTEPKNQELVVCRPEEPIVIDGDRVRLTQVLSNLLNNAVKYSGEGGRIELRLATEGAFASVSVQDSGIGIAPGCLERIFDLFAQGDQPPATSQGGLGIGLTLARRLVEMHGGSLRATSEGPGKGSLFTVRLPLVTTERPTQVAHMPPPNLVMPRRILVVDDFTDVADTLALLLSRCGHQVRVAYSAAEALALAPEFAPDVLLLDIALPDMDGHGLARQLRALPETKNGLYIALSGFGQPKDIEESRASGFDYYLVKPIEFTTINTILASLGGPIESSAR